MRKDINKTTLMGHAGRNPEVHVSGAGTLVSFSLATNERMPDGRGGVQEIPEWHEVVATGRFVEIVREHVHKGAWVYLEGRIQTRFWDDKDTGEQRSRKEIFVQDLNVLSYRSDAEVAQHRSLGTGSVEYVRYTDQRLSVDEVPF